MSLRIVHYNEPILRKKGEKVIAFDANLAALAADMVDAMHDAAGIGLAAQQIGRALQLCVVDLRDAGDVAAAEDDLFAGRLIGGFARHRDGTGRAVEGHVEPFDLQVLGADVGGDRVRGGLVGRIDIDRCGRSGGRLAAEEFFAGFLDETDQAHGCLPSW